MSGTHAQTPQSYNGVSTLDEPSAAWGWHGLSRSAMQKAGWISVAFLLVYNFGNHHGHVETIWLLALAVLVAIALLLQLFSPKLNQVRTVTARNKPEGWQEPDWAYDQKHLTGAYAQLDEAQLRSLNIDPATAPTQGAAARHALDAEKN